MASVWDETWYSSISTQMHPAYQISDHLDHWYRFWNLGNICIGRKTSHAHPPFCSPHWPYCFGILGEVWGDFYSRQLLEVSLLVTSYCSIVCCSILEPLGELQLQIAALSQHPTPQGRFRKILEFSTNRRSNWSTNVNLKYKWSFDFDGHIENDG